MKDLAARKQNAAFHELMQFEARRARDFYASAVAELPPEDARNMVAAEIMHSVYKKLLDKMERGGFRVLEQRYSLGKARKFGVVMCAWVANFLNRG